MTEPEQLKSVEEFLFGAPLYKTYKLPDDLKIAARIYGRVRDLNVDGHCPFCGRESTFFVPGVQFPGGDPWTNIKSRNAFDEMSIACVRNDNHEVVYYFLIQSMKIQKIGNYHLDVANRSPIYLDDR